MTTQDITVSLNTAPPFYRLYMRQGDTGRAVNVHVVDGSGPFDLTGLAVEFSGIKPSGKKFQRSAGITTSGNTATVEIEENDLAVPGIVACDLSFTNSSGKTVGTVVWEINVWEAPVKNKDLTDTEEFQTVKEAVYQTKEYRDEAAQYAANASTSAAESQGYANEAEAFKNQAQAIKDSTEMEYDVQSSRVGFKRKDEPVFKYTGDLRGKDGVAMVAEGMFAFEVNSEGNLIMTYGEGVNPNQFYINENGDLMMDPERV